MPWTAPGSGPPPQWPVSAPPPPPRPRTPVWAWVAIVAVVVLLAGSLAGAAAISRDPPRRTTTGGNAAPSTIAPPTTVPDPTAPTVAPPPTAAPDTTLPQATLEDQLLELELITEELRGLPFLHELDLAIVASEELARRVVEANERDIDPEALEAEGRALGLLGVIPADIAADYRGFFDRLLSEQVAGFYDPETGELVVGAPGGELDVLSRITTVHEMVHGLTDQHFAFGPRTDELYEQRRSDELAAFVAVIEGDAVLVQSFYVEEYLTFEELLEAQASIPDTPIFNSAPRFIRDALLFPYNEGAQFVTGVFEDGGWDAVDELYENPPTTTEQVLHPDKLAAREPAIPVELPALDLGPGWQEVERGDWGEFALRLVLRDRLRAGEAASAAAGWGGDAFVQYHNGDATLLALRVVGDDAAEAAELHGAFTDFLASWEDDGLGASRLALQGETVTVVWSNDAEALPAAARDLGI